VVHRYCCISNVCLLIVEGDGDGVSIGKIGVIVGEFSKLEEEGEVAEVEEFGMALCLIVLSSTHRSTWRGRRHR
jgi:hypothetical protein